jgi:hypothetical protein
MPVSVHAFTWEPSVFITKEEWIGVLDFKKIRVVKASQSGVYRYCYTQEIGASYRI